MEIRKIVPSNELYHHGVKGQQWGERNGPPYPLDAKGSSLRKQKRIYKKQQKHIKKIQKAADSVSKETGYNNKYTKTVVNRLIKNTEKAYQLEMKSVNDPSIKKTESYQKAQKIMNDKYLLKASIRGLSTQERINKVGLSANDIDDDELIELNKNNKNFKKEYNIK